MQNVLGKGLLVLLVATGLGCDSTPPPNGVSPNLALGVMVGGAANLTRGASVPVAVTVSRVADFTGAIDLSIGGLPAGVTATFVPTTVPAGSTTSVLTLSASATAALGTAEATVGARADGVGFGTVQLIIVVAQ